VLDTKCFLCGFEAYLTELPKLSKLKLCMNQEKWIFFFVEMYNKGVERSCFTIILTLIHITSW
jgi:hypothetical protein